MRASSGPHTAFSDERILAADDAPVRFTHTDSRTGAHWECELPAEEFLRRYLQHILPTGPALLPSAKR